MENPWTVKTRPDWKSDPVFLQFNKLLYDELWSFEETLDYSTIAKMQFKTDFAVLCDEMKKKWLEYVEEWNGEEGLLEKLRTKGFAALTFIFIVLPYDQLTDVGKIFTEFEVNAINVCHFCNTNGDNLPFANIDDLFTAGPILPFAYEEWLNNKYDRSSWWISYMVYEKRNGLEPIIDSPPAKLK